jgi:hypothetical protein
MSFDNRELSMVVDPRRSAITRWVFILPSADERHASRLGGANVERHRGRAAGIAGDALDQAICEIGVAQAELALRLQISRVALGDCFVSSCMM